MAPVLALDPVLIEQVAPAPLGALRRHGPRSELGAAEPARDFASALLPPIARRSPTLS